MADSRHDNLSDTDTDDAITQSRIDRLKAEQAKVVGRVERARGQL